MGWADVGQKEVTFKERNGRPPEQRKVLRLGELPSGHLCYQYIMDIPYQSEG